MSVVGLDFGNQNAVIAAAGRGGVDVILNGNSNRLNDNMVSFKESRFMGENAKVIANSNFKNTISNMKRLIGLSFDDARAQAEMKRVPFTCVPMKHTSGPASIGVKVNFNDEEIDIPIEAVAGMLIRHMGEIVASKSAENSNADIKDLFPTDWVISIPGYYTDAQRRALLAGCKIVGIDNVQRLMHEHTATGLAYGIFKDIRKEFTKDKPTNVMFLDLGQTAYTCSIISFEPGKLIVKSAHYDEDLGGRDFDMKIAEWIAMKFEEKYRGKLSGKPLERPKTLLKILDAAEKAKKTLSPTGVKEVRINLEMLMDDYDFQITLTSEEYEELCAPLLARLNAPIQRALTETGLTTKDFSSFELVGGGSRVGCVKITLAKILGTDLNATNNGLSTTMNADEAVARGTALQSAILSPRFKVLPYEIVEAQPYPVKISWEGDAAPAEGEEEPTNSVIMFDRGSNFNSVRRVTLRRSGEFVVHASYDESADKFNFPAGISKEICAFKIKSHEGGLNKVRVNVKQDIHGSILLSSAQMIEEVDEEPSEEAKDTEMKEADGEDKTDKKKKVKKTNLEFTELRSMAWTKAEMDAFYEKEVAMRNVDRLIKETSDMRNKLESYVYDMRDKIMSESQLAPFATEEEKASFNDLLEKAENWLYEDGFDAKKSAFAEKLSSLQKVGNPIEMRQSEAEARPNAMAVLQRSVEKYQNWTNTSQGNEDYAHITEEEFKKCKDICDSTSSWMYEAMDKQGSLPLSSNPFVTVAEISAKTQELAKVLSPIMHKPKPKPKPEEKKEEEKPAEDNTNESASEPMETDSTRATESPMDTSA